MAAPTQACISTRGPTGNKILSCRRGRIHAVDGIGEKPARAIGGIGEHARAGSAREVAPAKETEIHAPNAASRTEAVGRGLRRATFALTSTRSLGR